MSKKTERLQLRTTPLVMTRAKDLANEAGFYHGGTGNRSAFVEYVLETGEILNRNTALQALANAGDEMKFFLVVLQ